MIAIPQIIGAMIIGTCYYMLAVAMTVYDDILSMVFQPIMGAIFSGIAILMLLIVGLRIRFIKRFNTWWKAHWWLPFVNGTVAFIMMCLLWSPGLRVQVMDPELDMMVDSIPPGFGHRRMDAYALCGFTLLPAASVA